jgi:hypothetical protein
MLVRCPSCDAVINNACSECPWCSQTREPVDQAGQKRFQFSLFYLLLIVSLAGAWLGLTLQGPR